MSERYFTARLLDLCDYHAEDIAKLWYKAVKQNPKTSSYRSLSEEECLSQAINLYKNLKVLFFAKDSYQQLLTTFGHYAEFTYRKDIPLPEAIYALILQRRHIWLYAEFQALYNTALDLYQTVESINKTVLLFDYAIYIVAQRYGELLATEK